MPYSVVDVYDVYDVDVVMGTSMMDDARFDRVVNALQLDDKEDMIIIVVERSATTPALEAFRWQTMVDLIE